VNYGINLSSHQVFPGNPWDFTGVVPNPDIREDKAFRDRWINNPKTEWNVYSLFAGSNPNCRVYENENDSNPPRVQYGFVGDFDAATNEADVAAGILRIGPHKPAYWGISLSGHAHIVWLFEKPLYLPENTKLVKAWLKFLRGKIPLHLFHIGFETAAFDEPTRRYTNGGNWKKLSEHVIPDEIVQGWFVEFCSKYKWEEAEHPEAEIPLEEVAKVFTQKYPRFADWPGAFGLKSQGPTFWVLESQSPKSAIVFANGMFTFSGHAPKSFWPWSDPAMLGAEFVQQFKTKLINTATEDIYWDEIKFWRKDGNGLWTTLNETHMSRHIIARGLSDRRDPIKRLSPLGEALNYIQDHRRIVGAAPFVYRQENIIYVNREPTLNVSSCTVMPPMPGDWRFCEEHIPFLYNFLTNFFGSKIEFEVFMAWWARTYQHAYLRRPVLGQCMFISGVVGKGKTLMSCSIFGDSLGGHENPARYMRGSDTFGGPLFKVGVWALDDGTTISDPSKRRLYTEIIKAMAANRFFEYHQKYKPASRTEWLGRGIITLNYDHNSVRALPEVGTDNMDKVIFLRTNDESPVKFPSEATIRETLARELPILCSILLKWEIPAHLRSGETRYEITSYHEPSLLRTAQQSSPLASFEDILDNWKTEYFKCEPKATEWVGTPFQLQIEILRDTAAEMAMRSYSIDAINRSLSGLKSRGYPLDFIEADGKRLVRIRRPENTPVSKAPESTEPPPQQTNSQFNNNK
jgi:hypothetical protein